MTIIYGHRHVLDIFFTTPVSKAKHFSTICHVSRPSRTCVQEEEEEHFLVGHITVSQSLLFVKKHLHAVAKDLKSPSGTLTNTFVP